MELITGVQALNVLPDWEFPEHEHDGLEIVGVLQGQVQLLLREQVLTLTLGQIVAIPPHLPHGWGAQNSAFLNVIHLLYAPRDLAQRMVPGALPRIMTLSKPQFAEYLSLFSRLLAIVETTPSQQARLLRAYLEIFLLTLLEEDHEQDPNLLAIYEIAAYMQLHLGEELSITSLARQFLLSEATLRRRFHAVFGVSPKQYLLELRLKEAQHLLATTTFSLHEIALQTGFFDLAHFSSTFRKQFGRSPSLWRSQEQPHTSTIH